MDIFWDWFFKDLVIREIRAYMRNHRNDIFNDYIVQYDDISGGLEKIRIYIINRDEGTTDIEHIVQKYNIQLCGLDREVRKLNEIVESYRDVINNLQKKLNTVNNIQPTSQSNDEYKFSSLNFRIENLNKEINDVKKKINDVKKKINEKNQEEQVDKYKTQIETLEQTVKEQNTIIDCQKKQINDLECNFKKLNAIVEQLVNKEKLLQKEQSIEENLVEKKSEEQYRVVRDEEQKKRLNTDFDVESIPVFNTHKETPQINVNDFVMSNSEKQYDIEKFNIVKTDKLFLSGDISKIKIELQKALNIDNVIEFLQQSSLENKQVYIDIFERYKKEIQKFIDTLDFDEDDDEIYENITGKFFKFVNDKILANVMIGIYRGIKNGQKDYELFLYEVNKYLNFCCIYTRYIRPNIKNTKNDYDDMMPLKKETNDVDKNDYIDEVERLPYYIDYLNEAGDRESFKCDGKFVVLRYEEKSRED